MKYLFFFTSDIKKEKEELLVEKQEVLVQDFLLTNILKIPHYGSRTSSSLKFLQTVNPEVAIIRVGEDNSFNHPH